MQSSSEQPQKAYSFSIAGKEPSNQRDDHFNEQKDTKDISPEVQNTVNDLIMQDILAKEDAAGNRER